MNGQELMGDCQRLYQKALNEWGSVEQVSHWETNITTFTPFWSKMLGFPIVLLNIPIEYKNRPIGAVGLVSTDRRELWLNLDETITEKQG
jgi:hypothetical protein